MSPWDTPARIEDLTSRTYSLTVPYRADKTVAELLKAGAYDWVGEGITDENFPHGWTGDESIEMELVLLGGGGVHGDERVGTGQAGLLEAGRHYACHGTTFHLSTGV
jgi:hypothetical protein